MSAGWLIVFAKAPRPGLVKTRLAPPLDLEQAAALYEAMLDDVLEASAAWAKRFDLEAVLAIHPPDALAEVVPRALPAFRLQAQRGQDLAQRMANAFAEAAAAGAPFALLRGSDSPALGPDHVEAALGRLEAGDDLVLTPDAGGGYALIGQRRPRRALFDVPMSTRDVLRHTLAIADSLGLQSSTTRATIDLDHVEDLVAIESLDPAESSDLCPRTVEAIRDLRSTGVLST